MIMDDPGPAVFEADPDDEYRLTFFARSPLLATGRETLMTMRCFEEAKLHGAIAWLGERQDLWAEWAEIARDTDGNTLSAHLVDLSIEDSLARFGSPDYMFEECLGATVQHLGNVGVEFRLNLATRQLPVARHAFGTGRERAFFMETLMTPGSAHSPLELSQLALLQGRDALSRELVAIVAQATTKSGPTVH